MWVVEPGMVGYRLHPTLTPQPLVKDGISTVVNARLQLVGWVKILAWAARMQPIQLFMLPFMLIDEWVPWESKLGIPAFTLAPVPK